MAAARPGMRLRRRARRTGFEVLNPLGKNAKGPMKGPFRILAAGRVACGRCCAHNAKNIYVRYRIPLMEE